MSIVESIKEALSAEDARRKLKASEQKQRGLEEETELQREISLHRQRIQESGVVDMLNDINNEILKGKGKVKVVAEVYNHEIPRFIEGSGDSAGYSGSSWEKRTRGYVELTCEGKAKGHNWQKPTMRVRITSEEIPDPSNPESTSILEEKIKTKFLPQFNVHRYDY
jgi:hypothetical protein